MRQGWGGSPRRDFSLPFRSAFQRVRARSRSFTFQNHQATTPPQDSSPTISTPPSPLPAASTASPPYFPVERPPRQRANGRGPEPIIPVSEAPRSLPATPGGANGSTDAASSPRTPGSRSNTGTPSSMRHAAILALTTESSNCSSRSEPSKYSTTDATSVQQLAIRHQLTLLRTIPAKLAARLLLGSPSSVNSSSSAGEVANAAGSLRDSEDEYYNDGRPQASPTRDNGDSMGLQVTPKAGGKRGRRHGLRPLHIDIVSDDENELSDSTTGGGGTNEKFVFTPSPAYRRPLEDGGLGEQEGRAVFAAGNFDLGGFTVSNVGLVSSPRNRITHRPSLNEGDNFIALSKLGSGNSGTVHKALHFPTMRIVALKALPLYDAERRAQMMRELKTLYLNLANIRHSPTTRSRVPSTASSCCASPPPALSTAEAAAVALQDHGLETELSTRTTIEPSVTPTEGERPPQLVDITGGEEETYCPYMVSFYDAFADAKHGCLNLVVDYMDGGSLQDIVDRGGCPNEDVIACISYQVLMGLDFLHQRKKIHRDIKPSNLLINSMGYVRIADFGVSRSMDVNDQPVDTFIGTLGYMSPERITGQEYSYEADIWSFGLSIVACTMGAFPLNTLVGGGGYWGLVHAVCDNPAPELPDGASDSFRDFVSRCFVKDPSKRASAKELLSHPFLTSRPELADPGHYCRLADCPESRQMKEAELDQICRAMRLHFKLRQSRSSGSGLKPEGVGNGSSGSNGNSMVLTRDMIGRLAEELDLEVIVVAERLRTLVGDVLEVQKASSHV